MSLAGVHSSRGDAYQTTIAAEWAIRALYEPIEFLELDSTSLDPSGNPISVDDVVIFHANRTRTYCQCKKNSPTHDKWTPVTLKDDLEKAGLQLARDPSGSVRFYSRSNFGDLSRIAEHALVSPDGDAFLQTLPATLQSTHSALSTCWDAELAKAGKSVYDWLRRLRFEVTSDIPDLRTRQLGYLKQLMTHPERAYEALTNRLDSITRRLAPARAQSATSSAERLTRESLVELITSAGSVQTPPRDEGELIVKLQQISKIGRSWVRTIRGKQIARSALHEELTAILATRPPSLLLHSGPGFGKTCILLKLVDTLEASRSHFVLYLQGRAYAGCNSTSERAALGLDADMIGIVARAAELRHTVVVIDSLDVLSLNREHASFGYFLSLLDRLATVRNVTVIAACRTFDLTYDTHLAQRAWIKQFEVPPLDWDTEVEPLLREYHFASEMIPNALREIIRNPRMLLLFDVIAQRGSTPRADSQQELTEQYLQTVIEREPEFGSESIEELSRLAAQMLADRRLDIPRARARLPVRMESAFLSAEVLIESAPGRLAFSHQTLLDVLAVRHAQRAGHSLLQFITQQPQTPFIRPTVRTFFFFLRARDPGQFRKQMRASIDSPMLAYHLKRLLVESLAEFAPTEDDWLLLRHLVQAHPNLFESVFSRARTAEWLRFLGHHWLPDVLATHDTERVLAYIDRLSLIWETDPGYTIAFWRRATSQPWIDARRLHLIIGLGSRGLAPWRSEGARELAEWLVDTASEDHDPAAGAICRFVEATDSGDDLLWRYISSATETQDPTYYHFGDRLRCGPEHGPLAQFLSKRMILSDVLLDLAIDAVNRWSDRRCAAREDERGWDDRFLHSTSYTRRHTSHDRYYVDSPTVLFGAIEVACLDRAARRSTWWVNNESRLRLSFDGALRYIALRVYTAHPEGSLGAIRAVLEDEEVTGSPRLRYEVNELIRAAITLLPEAQQIALERHALQFGEAFSTTAAEVAKWRRDRLSAIPAFLRSPLAQQYLNHVRQLFSDTEERPEIESSSGVIAAAISDSELLSLSNEALVRLLRYIYPEHSNEADRLRSLQFDQISWQLMLAASRHPERHLDLLSTEWLRIPSACRHSILDGVANHLRIRFGNLSLNTPWEPVSRPEGPELASALLTELEAHWHTWRGTLTGAQALNACARVLEIPSDADRFSFLLIGTWNVADHSFVRTSGADLLTSALNDPRGVATEAAAVLAGRMGQSSQSLNTLLCSSLKFFAASENLAIQAVLIHYLPGIQAHFPEFGWRLFSSAIRSAPPSLWKEAERCLYHGYHRDFVRVKPFLDLAKTHVGNGTGALWGRIASLAMLSEHISPQELVVELRSMANSDAWQGAASVFATNAPQTEHQERCFEGLRICFADAVGASPAAREMTSLFRSESAPAIPEDLLTLYFQALEATHSDTGAPMYEFQKWLARRVEFSADDAVKAAEIAVLKGPKRALHIWDEKLYPRILTSLFREAEEREELDQGAFLRRVIAIQDALVRLGDIRMNDWLAAAERP